MYTRGHVEDYRYTYDMSGPDLGDMLGLLRAGSDQAWAAAAAAAAAGSSAAEASGAGLGVASPKLEQGSEDVGGEEEGEGADGEGQQLRPAWARRGGRPLLPAACAMALLPGLARTHAPTALQHLMDEDSPLADIYAVCPDCAEVGQLNSIGGWAGGRAGGWGGARNGRRRVPDQAPARAKPLHTLPASALWSTCLHRLAASKQSVG